MTKLRSSAERNLKVNASKTQMIIFKSPGRKLPANVSNTLDNVLLAPSTEVCLLGVTIDHHFTMGQHIESVVKKCRGLLGMLRRSSSHLPIELRKLIYIAVIRSQIEYCSAVFINSAPSHLLKLPF